MSLGRCRSLTSLGARMLFATRLAIMAIGLSATSGLHASPAECGGASRRSLHHH